MIICLPSSLPPGSPSGRPHTLGWDLVCELAMAFGTCWWDDCEFGKVPLVYKSEIAITMVLNECPNHLPFLIARFVAASSGLEFEDGDCDVLLHQIFVSRMQLDSGKQPSKPSQRLTATFGKPAKPGSLNMWQRRALKANLEQAAPSLNHEPEVFQMDYALENIPKYCVNWAFYTPEAVAVDGSFKLILDTMRRRNSTRNSSMVVYTMTKGEGYEHCAVGEVLFFFTIDVVNDSRTHVDETVDEEKYYLAYLQQF